MKLERAGVVTRDGRKQPMDTVLARCDLDRLIQLVLDVLPILSSTLQLEETFHRLKSQFLVHEGVFAFAMDWGDAKLLEASGDGNDPARKIDLALLAVVDVASIVEAQGEVYTRVPRGFLVWVDHDSRGEQKGRHYTVFAIVEDNLGNFFRAEFPESSEVVIDGLDRERADLVIVFTHFWTRVEGYVVAMGSVRRHVDSC